MNINFKVFLIESILLLGLLPSAALGMLTSLTQPLNPNQGILMTKVTVEKPREQSTPEPNFEEYQANNNDLSKLQTQLEQLTNNLEQMKNNNGLDIPAKLQDLEKSLEQITVLQTTWTNYFADKPDEAITFEEGNKLIKKSTEKYKASIKTLTIKKCFGKTASFCGKTILVSVGIAAMLYGLDWLLKGRTISNYHIGTASSVINDFVCKNVNDFWRWAKYTKEELRAMMQAEQDRMMAATKLEQATQCLNSVDTFKPCAQTIENCSKNALEFYNKIKPANGSELNAIPYAPNHAPSTLAKNVLDKTRELKQMRLNIIKESHAMAKRIASHGEFKLEQAQKCLQNASSKRFRAACIEPVVKYAKSFKLPGLKTEANMILEKTTWEKAGWFKRKFMNNPDMYNPDPAEIGQSTPPQPATLNQKNNVVNDK